MEEKFKNQHLQILLPIYQISAHIDESTSVRPVDGVQIVEPAWFGPIQTGKQLPGLLVVVQHDEVVVFVLRDNQRPAQLTLYCTTPAESCPACYHHQANQWSSLTSLYIIWYNLKLASFIHSIY